LKCSICYIKIRILSTLPHLWGCTL